MKIINKTRKQLIKEEKYKLVKQAVDDGFYYFEVGEIFKMTKVRVCQILKVGKNNNKAKKS